MKKAILFSVIFVLILNSYGQVGIGTTSPGSKLEVKGTGNTTSSSSLNITNSSSNSMLYVRDDGYIGFGTTAPSRKFEIIGNNTNANSAMVVVSSHSTDNNVKYGFYSVKHYSNSEEPLGLIAGESNTNVSYVKIGGGFNEVNAATSVSFFTAGTTTTPTGSERMTITSSGRVGIGTSSPSYQLDVQGGDINASGSVRAATVALTSDMRLKNISETISSNDNINTIRYEWKDGRDSRMHIGYGAQDVEKILPDAVYTDAEGLKAVNYDEVHTYKLQLQEERIRELERRLDEMSKLLKRKRRLK